MKTYVNTLNSQNDYKCFDNCVIELSIKLSISYERKTNETLKKFVSQ